MVTDKSCGIARLLPYFYLLANYETHHNGRIWEFQHPSLLLLVFTKAAADILSQLWLEQYCHSSGIVR